jgi:hypothetical protein
MSTYRDGKALAIDNAGLFVSGFPEQWVCVQPEDQRTTFRIHLPQGPRHVRAQFTASATGYYSAAYYVYVRRVG